MARRDDTRDGFHVERDKFDFPEDFEDLSACAKRAVTVCDLFLNNSFTVDMITRFLHDDYGNVVRTLINQGVIKDRRLRLR